MRAFFFAAIKLIIFLKSICILFPEQHSLDRQAAAYSFCSMPFRPLVIIMPMPALVIGPAPVVPTLAIPP